MTCQHCQTWILDDDHRCRRCGRRVRATPARISQETYPIAATATARAYDFDAVEESRPFSPQVPDAAIAGQEALFSGEPAESRVIPFDSLTSPAEREAIRTRAADVVRPTPLRAAKVEVRRVRPKREQSASQRRLDFQGQDEILSQPQTHIICDAPVAPPGLRVQAAAIDGAMVGCAWLFGAALFVYEGGTVSADKHLLPFFLAALATVPILYKVLWTFAGRDSFGMQASGLRLVDFDGNPPASERRYQRLFGSFISFLAAGMGLVWALVDEDSLTWHDHISSTFPTIAAEE